MTGDPIKDLTDGEKLNLILAKLFDVETRLARLEAQLTKPNRPRPDRDSHLDGWLDYRDAAKMMGCPVTYFHRRGGLGEYKYWPQIERWQPGGRGTRLYVRREHVEDWIERSRTPSQCPVKIEPTGIGYEGALPELLRLGAHKTIRALGLSAHIARPNTTAKKANRR